jgi:hypothetical protein
MIQEIIDRVRTCRNSKIKIYSDKLVVLEYFQQQAFDLSDRKYEFLSRELNDLLIAPIDLVHYSSVITELKQSPGKPGLDEHCEQLAMEELVKIFKKYTF